MATNKYTYAMVMAMDETSFTTLATSKNKEWLEEAVNRTEARKQYPRVSVWSDEKQKYVHIADKTKKPTVKMVAISFFTLKKAFCEEVLKIEKIGAKKKPTFRERMAIAASK